VLPTRSPGANPSPGRRRIEFPAGRRGSSLFLVPCSLVIGHWSLVIGHWSLVIGHWVAHPVSIFSPSPRYSGERGSGGEGDRRLLLRIRLAIPMLIPSSPALLPGVPRRREQESIRSSRELGYHPIRNCCHECTAWYSGDPSKQDFNDLAPSCLPRRCAHSDQRASTDVRCAHRQTMQARCRNKPRSNKACRTEAEYGFHSYNPNWVP
jgi:hypothetical protein